MTSKPRPTSSPATTTASPPWVCRPKSWSTTVVVTFWRDGLVVTAYLGEVARLELQGDLHQRVRNVSGGFIGDGVFGRLGCALARHRGRSGLTLQSRPSCGSSCLR